MGRRGGGFLLKQHMTTVGGHDGSYDTCHAEERDDNETTRQCDNDDNDDNNFSPCFTPPKTFAHGKL